MVGEDQSIEAVFVVDLALHPRSASAAVAIADLGDRQVEVVLGHLLVSVVWLVNRLRVNTHEPCGLNRIKPDSKGIRILFFGAYLRAEMLDELCGCGLHISQLVEERFMVVGSEAARIGISSTAAYRSLIVSPALVGVRRGTGPRSDVVGWSWLASCYSPFVCGGCVVCDDTV